MNIFEHNLNYAQWLKIYWGTMKNVQQKTWKWKIIYDLFVFFFLKVELGTFMQKGRAKSNQIFKKTNKNVKKRFCLRTLINRNFFFRLLEILRIFVALHGKTYRRLKTGFSLKLEEKFEKCIRKVWFDLLKWNFSDVFRTICRIKSYSLAPLNKVKNCLDREEI